MARVSTYRFGKSAALATLGTSGTVYLDAKAARALARRLYVVARSIESESFTESSVGTLTVQARAHGEPFQD